MNIWHIIPYDTIPGEDWRPGRAITLCNLLAENGHQVTWWTSNYSHFFKRFRSSGWSDIKVNKNLTIKLVPVPGYQKHISFARLWFHFVFAWRLYQQALKETPPDCIILSMPTPGADWVAVKLAQRFKAQLIIDIRDIWPELFILALPSPLQRLGPILFYPFYALRKYALKHADAVTAVTQTYLNIALENAPNIESKNARVVYFGADVAHLRKIMNEGGNTIQKHPDDIWLIYAGTLGDNYDLHTILEAAVQLKEKAPQVKILIAGNGPMREHMLQFMTRYNLNNVIYLGTLPLEALSHYYCLSDIGLSPYHKSSTVSMPAKIYDYFAAGLPVINSLEGEVADLLSRQNIGIQYISGNVESLVYAICKLTEDKELRQVMAKSSYSIAMQYDRQQQFKQFLELI